MALAKVFVNQTKEDAESIAGSLRSTSPRTLAILITTFFLLCSGLGNLYSITAFSQVNHFSGQLNHAILGLFVIGIVGFWIPVREWKNYSLIIYLATMVLLIIVELFGHTTMGAQRWIGIGPIRFQPSEFAKIVGAIFVASFFESNAQSAAYTIKDLWKIILGMGLLFVLIFLQPDLGTASVCILITASQVAFVRIDRKNLIALASIGFAAVCIAWMFMLHSYQKQRVLTLFSPNSDRSGAGYNSLQSIVAVGSGKFTGKGFLKGSQAQLQFLPEKHTDFIFAAFAEEHGFIGCAVVLALFCFLIYSAIDVAKHARNTFSQFLALGIAGFFLIEVGINCCMVMGIFPVVGVPLPFFSNGGSAMLTNSFAVALLIAIDRETKGAINPTLLGK